MNDYKELYYFLFNRISDMIQELQLLQQQTEEAFVLGYSHTQQPALRMQQALPDAEKQASYILTMPGEEFVAAPGAQDDTDYEVRAIFSESCYSKTRSVTGSSRQLLPFERPKPQLPPPAIAPEFSRRPAAE